MCHFPAGLGIPPSASLLANVPIFPVSGIVTSTTPGPVMSVVRIPPLPDTELVKSSGFRDLPPKVSETDTELGVHRHVRAYIRSLEVRGRGE